MFSMRKRRMTAFCKPCRWCTYHNSNQGGLPAPNNTHLCQGGCTGPEIWSRLLNTCTSGTCPDRLYVDSSVWQVCPENALSSMGHEPSRCPSTCGDLDLLRRMSIPSCLPSCDSTPEVRAKGYGCDKCTRSSGDLESIKASVKERIEARPDTGAGNA